MTYYAVLWSGLPHQIVEGFFRRPPKHKENPKKRS
jgi:hypothetical protein